MSKKFSLSFISILCLSLGLINLYSCADQDAYSVKKIRAHGLNINGVMHAQPSLNAERYCSECHGQNLVGGGNGEPSCYQCHGKSWTDNERSFAITNAPADHTEVISGFHHNPAHSEAEIVCSACHGEQLEGVGGSGTPPCLLCHGPLWE